MDALSSIDEQLHDRLDSSSKLRRPGSWTSCKGQGNATLGAVQLATGLKPAMDNTKKETLEEQRSMTQPEPSYTAVPPRASFEILAESNAPVVTAPMAPRDAPAVGAAVTGLTWDWRDPPTNQEAAACARTEDEMVDAKRDLPPAIPASLTARATARARNEEAEAAAKRRRSRPTKRDESGDAASHPAPKQELYPAYATEINF